MPEVLEAMTVVLDNEGLNVVGPVEPGAEDGLVLVGDEGEVTV